MRMEEETEVLVRHAGHQGLPSETPTYPSSLDHLETLQFYQISILYQLDISNGTHHETVRTPCIKNRILTSENRGKMDLFQSYRCQNRVNTHIVKQNPGTPSQSGFIYEIVTTEPDDPNFHMLPSIWLASQPGIVQTLAPYLVPPFQPTARLCTIFKTTYAQRKFITFPALVDALFGSKPTYKKSTYTSGPRRQRLNR
ncbi:hypothetical protein OPQ81_000718 [Rhizoctonia solani]|nr:hypothetical protein OPQ81_000718 [Rhizoctonia solani]